MYDRLIALVAVDGMMPKQLGSESELKQAWESELANHQSSPTNPALSNYHDLGV
jgi:hypothetical protein